MIQQRHYVTVNYSLTSKLRICKFPTVQSYFLAHLFILGLNLQPNKFRLLCLRTVRKCSNSARFPVDPTGLY